LYPPEKTPRVDEETAPVTALVTVKSPKSVALPVDDIVT